MSELEQKYMTLLLTRCLNFDKSKSLFIHLDLKDHLEFAQKLKRLATEMGILDVYICLNDLDEMHDYLLNTNVKDIELNPIIDKSAFDIYAKKGAAFLILKSFVPDIMKDIEDVKIFKMNSITAKGMSYYQENLKKFTFPWSIAALPNERWAKSIFGNSPSAYQQLYLNILKMCMVDQKDPALAWDNYLNQNNQLKKILNEMQIRKMHFSNSLGTNLTVYLPRNVIWTNLDIGNNTLANMPSYELFTTPDYRLTKGIVYSSKPLLVGGKIIDRFYLKFSEGRVIDCHAEVGNKLLEKIVFELPNTGFLGEVALVPYNSPINNTGLIFNESLFDENASSHLALGQGFSQCFPNGQNLSMFELEELGMNCSCNHIDFMIGTSDLEVVADTPKGRKLIMKDGNFNL